MPPQLRDTDFVWSIAADAVMLYTRANALLLGNSVVDGCVDRALVDPRCEEPQTTRRPIGRCLPCMMLPVRGKGPEDVEKLLPGKQHWLSRHLQPQQLLSSTLQNRHNIHEQFQDPQTVTGDNFTQESSCIQWIPRLVLPLRQAYHKTPVQRNAQQQQSS
ncbi:hypothetical protein Nepgr_018005 [Nepenthes gracilis]|uniref:Uncharacterized protein n=1 Tax=Nepenthes gracilis TaxID=150966 RepID=A0AAD3SSP7_NEPGR|nr:hypothetical protein Nepgr_018005 [Nepenthes gracilis]